MLLKALRRKIRNYLTKHLIEDVFNSALDKPAPQFVVWEQMDTPFPTWKTLVSYSDVTVTKPGLSFSSTVFGYRPYTEFKGKHSYLVRPYSSCILIRSNQKQKHVLIKDRLGNLCFIEGLTIPNIVESPARLSPNHFLGIAESGTIRVTYFDTSEQTILPITECLVDR